MEEVGGHFPEEDAFFEYESLRDARVGEHMDEKWPGKLQVLHIDDQEGQARQWWLFFPQPRQEFGLGLEGCGCI